MKNNDPISQTLIKQVQRITMQYIDITVKDDSQFISIIKNIITNILEQRKPEEIYIFKLDNWFDHKWLNYSGLGVISDTGEDEVKLGEFRKRKTTIPPFNPTRIVSSKYYLLNKVNIYQEQSMPKQIHRDQQSQQNIHRPIKDQTNSGIFFWYSSNTRNNQRGSLMTYIIKDENIDTWYASFLCANKK